MRPEDIWEPVSQSIDLPKIQEIIDWSHGKGPLNPRKGIMIQGPAGSGKTSLMRAICKDCFIPMADTRTVSKQASESGISGLDQYYKPIWHKRENRHRNQAWFFDDLGAASEEQVINHFGTVIRPMCRVIDERYDIWEREGWVSIFTTNLTPAMLNAQYGERATDRLRGMCNIVVFTGGSQR